MTDWKLETKPCENPECDVILRPKLTDTERDFRNRRTCSYVCGGIVGHLGRKPRCCRICGEPISQERIRGGRATCGKDACMDAAAGRPASGSWPRVTGEFVGDFSPHNLVINDRRVQKLDRPINRTLGGIGSAWMGGA